MRGRIYALPRSLKLKSTYSLADDPHHLMLMIYFLCYLLFRKFHISLHDAIVLLGAFLLGAIIAQGQ